MNQIAKSPRSKTRILNSLTVMWKHIRRVLHVIFFDGAIIKIDHHLKEIFCNLGQHYINDILTAGGNGGQIINRRRH